MVDRLTPKQRSAVMARIKRSDTKPEIVVRKLLHRLG
jgi:DNA mismatch endonuclease (patch repair protein)